MGENNFLKETLDNTVLSRRSFLKWSAALGGSAALVGGGLSLGLQAAQDSSPGDKGCVELLQCELRQPLSATPFCRRWPDYPGRSR